MGGGNAGPNNCAAYSLCDCSISELVKLVGFVVIVSSLFLALSGNGAHAGTLSHHGYGRRLMADASPPVPPERQPPPSFGPRGPPINLPAGDTVVGPFEARNDPNNIEGLGPVPAQNSGYSNELDVSDALNETCSVGRISPSVGCHVLAGLVWAPLMVPIFGHF